MVKPKHVVKGKVLKKEWYPIKSTRAFNSTALGESYVVSPSLLLDRRLTVNLANLTGDIRQQGVSLHFRISEVDRGAGVADVVGYEASSAQLKRLVRRGVERLDDSVVCLTSDGKRLKVKPFAVTRASASKYKLRLMRGLLRKALVEEVGKQDFDSLVRSVISNKLQSTLKSVAKKVFPLRVFAIRKLELVDSGVKSVGGSLGAGGDKKSGDVVEESVSKGEAGGESEGVGLVKDAEK